MQLHRRPQPLRLDRLANERILRQGVRRQRIPQMEREEVAELLRPLRRDSATENDAAVDNVIYPSEMA